MKFKRQYFFGGDTRDTERPDDDWVCAYIAENGKRIECEGGLLATTKYYTVDGETFSTLKEAKAFCEAEAANKPEKETEIEIVETYAATRIFRLPKTTTPEDLGCRWSCTLNFGDKILLAGHFYNGAGKPSYYGAVYEFTTDDHTCEGQIKLVCAAAAFEDNGHAIAWAMQQ